MQTRSAGPGDGPPWPGRPGTNWPGGDRGQPRQPGATVTRPRPRPALSTSRLKRCSSASCSSRPTWPNSRRPAVHDPDATPATLYDGDQLSLTAERLDHLAESLDCVGDWLQLIPEEYWPAFRKL